MARARHKKADGGSVKPLPVKPAYHPDTIRALNSIGEALALSPGGDLPSNLTKIKPAKADGGRVKEVGKAPGRKASARLDKRRRG